MMELEEFAKKELQKHKRIMKIVKEYVDGVLAEMGINVSDIDKNTYFAMIMELTRSIFVNWSVQQRQLKWRRK